MDRKLFVIPILTITLLSTVASSTSTLRVENINTTDVGKTSITFTWKVSGLDNVTDSALLRSYIRLKSNLNIVFKKACLPIDKTSFTFNFVQPYTTYIACVKVVSVESDTGCDDDSEEVSSNEPCAAATTEFEIWSAFSLAAVACAGGIIIACMMAVIINFVIPVKKLNDTVDKDKMEAWSTKKRYESVRDFVTSVRSNSPREEDE